MFLGTDLKNTLIFKNINNIKINSIKGVFKDCPQKHPKKGMRKMAKTEPRTLSGFMELLPNEQILFNQMREKIENTYKKFGFLPLDTPIVELSEVLHAKAGGETEKQIYRFNKGDTYLSLRFDLTLQL